MLTAEAFAGIKPRATTANESGLPVVGMTADISLPFTGQTIHNTADGLIYRHTGFDWLGCVAVGGSTPSTMHEARYHQIASAQVFVTGTDTKVKFEEGIYACGDVTPSGTGNTDFLLNRAGVWRISAGLRLLGNAGGGERNIWIQRGMDFTFSLRQGWQSQVNVSSAPVSLNCSDEIRVDAGTSVCIGMWHSAGSDVTADIGFGGTNHIALTWLRPL